MSDAACQAGAPTVILVRTQMGENVGASARAMLNFGLERLRLVDPQCGWPNAKAVASASGATVVLNRLEQVADVDEATADLHLTYATTARDRGLAKPLVTARQAALEMRAHQAAGRHVGLLFGPERTGLETPELQLADALVFIPTNPAFTSLNVAQAVLLLANEWWQAGETMAARTEDPTATAPVSKAQLRHLLDHLVRELDAVDFFRADDRRISLSRQLEVILTRAGLREPEAHLLHGVIKSLVRGRRGPGG
ncbi:MAG: RNA methyltransferase [Geminicoccaceae bacterium]